MAFLGYSPAIDDIADMMCGFEIDCLAFYYGNHVYTSVPAADDCAMDASDCMSDIPNVDS